MPTAIRVIDRPEDLATAYVGLLRGDGAAVVVAAAGIDYAAAAHTHAAADLTTGTVAVARLPVLAGSGTGHAAGIVPDPGATPGTTRFLREDAAWATVAGGTVTSVGLTMPGVFAVASTPVTTTGTIDVTFLGQGGNTVLASPANGTSAAPVFRALVAADLGTGTASGSTYLRGDLTWATPTAGLAVGSAITGGAASRVLHEDASQNLTTTTGFQFGVTAGYLDVPTGYRIGGTGGPTFSVYGGTVGYFIGSLVVGNSTFLGTAATSPKLIINVFNSAAANYSPLALEGVASQTAPLLPLRQTSSTALRDCAYIDAAWATVTDASRKGRLVLAAADSTVTRREGLRIESDGTQPLVGFYGVPAVARAATPGTAAGTDAAVINAVITLLRNLGLCS